MFSFNDIYGSKFTVQEPLSCLIKQILFNNKISHLTQKMLMLLTLLVSELVFVPLHPVSVGV